MRGRDVMLVIGAVLLAAWIATCTGREVDDDVFETMDRGVDIEEVRDGGWI